MRIVTCTKNGQHELGIIINDRVYTCSEIALSLPTDMADFLIRGDEAINDLVYYHSALLEGRMSRPYQLLQDSQLVAPIPHPTSVRDAYAFRQHVATSRRNRGLDMIPEFDEFPVFYFSNHQAIQGPGPIQCMPLHLEQLDFELEVAIVINKTGINIPASEADKYIAGYMIMNDFSARKLQMDEMKLSLGPAKGKDFATAIGPWLVTKDELEPYKINSSGDHIGDRYNLEMSCRVNGQQVSSGNFATMHWTFAEIIERVSYGVRLFPGDVIGSGTVGTGCFLELNGTGRMENPAHQDQWLQVGDQVELEITGLGKLSNSVVLYQQ
ncbi:fumarylacetoacetate hydrolase family protein [Sphingobacterium sp. ML3W]|uniref:fumarylacetoacetate hydrolase family protein n=1 Tax=Sphingobacterium TaxID=28453 RepID=UPI00249BA0A4|nr:MULTISPECIES: fumarylacetoacetate hydrolase family protein [Sphingobacterium]WFA79906.1 fumarylacetoacetate hydrolase family protein [Sphingobacterium sp. ML3W]